MKQAAKAGMDDRAGDGVARLMALQLVGGHPALDLVNTVDWRDRDDRSDTLTSYAALLAWCQRLGLLSAEIALTLDRAARQAPAEAQRHLAGAIELREATARLAQGMGREPDLALLNRWLAEPPEPAMLKPRPDGGFSLTEPAHTDLAAPLRVIARVCADLLASDRLKRVRCCGGPGCGWLFVDTSPNRRRRWCSMESCGNRAKARRHYAHTRA